MKIVIVEDNQTLLNSMVRVLTDEGHRTHCFTDGESARKWLMVEHAAVDLCLVDYMLPELDGVALIKALRKANIMLPVLMLTARTGVADKVYGLESGADYYLTKPFSFDELLACLKALYRRPHKYQLDRVELQPEVVCDLNTHVLTKSGVVVSLTLTEFSILAYLIRNRGLVVSQQELYEHVFDFAKENWSNTIEVHIKNLRKKIQHKNYENPVKTIRGVGYTLEI
jgi:two-component system, OmpR family, copper resistance phosphate regulon response regulator CusR